MFGATVIGLAMFAPAEPVPGVPPAAKVEPVDRGQAVNFAYIVTQLAARIEDEYTREVKLNALVEGAVRGLHEEAGVPVSEDLLRKVQQAGDHTELVNLLVEARMRLGNVPQLSGARSLFAAIGGFRHAIDPACGLVSQRLNTYASIDQDFGIGIELEGTTGPRWGRYQVEYATGLRWLTPSGYFGPVPAPNAVPPPVALPWRVKRVIPGSPAQLAGVRPGDAITHLNGTAITPQNAAKLFAEFAFPPGVPGPGLPMPAGIQRKFTLARSGELEPISVEVLSANYSPECLFGARRRDDDSWDCMLDRERKIGYIRVGPVEEHADEQMAAMIDDLVARDCRALILDFRWCPGGYVTPATKMAGLFVPKDSVIARMQYRHPERAPTGPEIRSPLDPRFPDLPLVLLIGSETKGGGELITAALQDNIPDRKRLVTFGQRTVGRAFIQTTTDAGFGNLLYRVTTGISLRPNGKPRQRTATSQPTDEWGVRPDAGLEVPVSADLMAELRLQAELHAIRPPESNDSLPFDDATKDPFRLAALVFLRKQLK